MTEEEKIVITEKNFSEYFHDVRRSKPKKGQVLAKFTAVAEFVEGRGKRDIIMLLKMDKAQQAVQVMRKIHGAREPDCYRVCREIAEDLLIVPEEEVEKKPYEYVVEYFFYTQKDLVPKNKHWETIQILEKNEAGDYISRIEI